MHHYNCYGLHAVFDRPSELFAPWQEEDGPVDVRLRHEVVPRQPKFAVAHWDEEGVTLRRPPGSFLQVRGGDEVIVDEDFAVRRGCPVGKAMRFALPALIHQRGGVLLHASAVSTRGRAVVFLAPSRTGKSTLTVALGRRGFHPVADDILGVIPSPEGVRLIGWERVMRLRHESVVYFTNAASPGEEGATGAGHRMPLFAQAERAPIIAAFVALRRVAGTAEPVVSPLPVEEAKRRLLPQIRIPVVARNIVRSNAADLMAGWLAEQTVVGMDMPDGWQNYQQALDMAAAHLRKLC